jgi:hypothetical protein
MCATLLGCVASRSEAVVVYSNDFSGAVGAEWTASPGLPAVVTSPGPALERFLGTGVTAPIPFSNDTATLSLAGLPVHDTLTLGFDVYFLHSWDGVNQSAVNPDRFTASVQGGPTLLDSSFAINTSWQQNFPNPVGGATVVARTGEDVAQAGRLGYNFFGPDMTYHFSFTIPHVANIVAFDFAGSNLQGWNDEGWGLDNVVVEVQSSQPVVPEPGTLSLLGLGAVALVRRRKR